MGGGGKCVSHTETHTHTLHRAVVIHIIPSIPKSILKHSYISGSATWCIPTYIICQEWDIDALEESTRYDGFKKTDKIIV